MKTMIFAVAMLASAFHLRKSMPVNCDKICASHWKPKEPAFQDKLANQWMTVNQDLSLAQKGAQPLDMGVTAAQCACMGITKITAKTGRELTGNEELDGRLLECDQKETNCKKCCQGDPAYRGCAKDQGEEACTNTCTMDHSKCEDAAKQWESR